MRWLTHNAWYIAAALTLGLFVFVSTNAVAGGINPPVNTTSTGVVNISGDLASPVNGNIWYNTSTNKFRCHENSSSVDCIGAGGGGTHPVALASDVSGILPIANGGTGSATQNFVDLTTGQSIAGVKVFNDQVGVSVATPLAELDIAGDTRITNGATTTLTGTIDPDGDRTITGVGTLFTTELKVGDRIVVNAETRQVTHITNNTTLTVRIPFTDTGNDLTPDRIPAIYTTETNGNEWTTGVDDVGKLVISRTGDSNNADLFIESYGNNASPRMSMYGGQGTRETTTASLSGDRIGRIIANGYDSVQFDDAVELEFFANENWSASAHGSGLRVKTVDNGSAALPATAFSVVGTTASGTTSVLTPTFTHNGTTTDLRGVIRNDGSVTCGSLGSVTKPCFNEGFAVVGAGVTIDSTINWDFRGQLSQGGTNSCNAAPDNTLLCMTSGLNIGGDVHHGDQSGTTPRVTFHGDLNTRIENLNCSATNCGGAFNPGRAALRVDCLVGAGAECTLTMGEANAVDGDRWTLVVDGATSFDVRVVDSAAVTELAGDFVGNAYDTLDLMYDTDRWVEVSRSNN